MTDIIRKLQDIIDIGDIQDCGTTDFDIQDAIDEIERLRASIGCSELSYLLIQASGGKITIPNNLIVEFNKKSAVITKTVNAESLTYSV